jgi:glycerophosphoryl diester phosphodiesterase
MKPLLLFIFIGFCTFSSCERVEYFPDNPIENPQTRMLAHKGGGNFDTGNTMPACMHGLKFTDGIEVDLQITSDNTLWLSHSAEVTGCGNVEQTCFALVSSVDVAYVDTCLGQDKDYVRLEEVLSYMHDEYPEKFISLDVKAWSPCGARGLDILHEMNQLAQAILDLAMKYDMENRILVESEVGDFLYYIKSRNPAIETYLAVLGDLELGVSRALGSGFDGISFHYKFEEPLTKEMVDFIHRKGLKIQLWTVNDPSDLEEARSIGADFIQTDNF